MKDGEVIDTLALGRLLPPCSCGRAMHWVVDGRTVVGLISLDAAGAWMCDWCDRPARGEV